MSVQKEGRSNIPQIARLRRWLLLNFTNYQITVNLQKFRRLFFSIKFEYYNYQRCKRNHQRKSLVDTHGYPFEIN